MKSENEDIHVNEKELKENDSSTLGPGEVFSLLDIDQALNAKTHLVNDAIDEIGWTNHHSKLFLLNGFGYAVDSMLLVLQSITAGPARLEFRPSFGAGLTIASYVGTLTGAIFWGLGADIIGRRTAFNTSLLLCSIFAIIAGASPNWEVLGLFITLSAFGGGGNLIMDTAVFLEYLPSNKQWVLTLMACWWGVGQMIAGLFAWAFLPNFSCLDAATCTRANNMGWRYEWFTCGALVFVMSILRVTVIHLKETPKFLLGQGRDEEVVKTLQDLAAKYDRKCSLTVSQLAACGTVISTHSAAGRFSFSETVVHFKGLFPTKKIGLSTALIWLSWTLIGLAYPLYYVFLPDYLESRGAETGNGSSFVTWRNYTLINFSGIWGPVLAGFMCETKWLGRRGTMIIGALVAMVFFFAYTQVRTAAENVGFNCAITFCLNIYYACLYAYTPEVLPSAHRTTGNGVAAACNRIMGIMSAVVATAANTATSVPIYVCAALYFVMAVVAGLFPFEPYGRRSA